MSNRYFSARSIRHCLALALLPIATATTILATPKIAHANCAGWGILPEQLIAAGFDSADEYYKAEMQTRWAQLQQMQTYPWGTARVYDRLLDDRIVLAASFDRLTTVQKRQVIDLLQIQYPQPVYASDGRLVSAKYDECNPHGYLFTERARFSWYYNSQGRSLPMTVSPDELRNAGRPAWRQVNYPIAAVSERSVRTLFWSRMGYSQVNRWWIAWVPEHGYFEINTPIGYSRQQLNRFLSAAPRQYRYVVVENDGITEAYY